MARVNSDEKPPSPSSSPTAVQIAAVAHETPSSLLSSITTLGVGCTAQLVPFQTSATVTNIPAFAVESDVPTAVHALAEVHEIAVRESCRKLAPEFGFGVALIFHVPLLHCSASVFSPVKPFVLGRNPVPAAMQTVLDEHFTPLSWMLLSPDCFGTVWVFQVLPFHRSASPLFPAYPTAVHALAEVQDTPRKRPPVVAGTDCSAQALPFHHSASGRFVPELFW
jgi:hypothetical protein